MAERPPCLRVLFIFLCSSRRVTPCMKVMFQWNINIIARRWKSMYFPGLALLQSTWMKTVNLCFCIHDSEISSFPDLVNGETMSHCKQLLIRFILFYTATFSSFLCSTEVLLNFLQSFKIFCLLYYICKSLFFFAFYWSTELKMTCSCWWQNFRIES